MLESFDYNNLYYALLEYRNFNWHIEERNKLEDFKLEKARLEEESKLKLDIINEMKGEFKTMKRKLKKFKINL